MNRALKILRRVDKYLEEHGSITLLQWNAFLLQATEEDAYAILKVKGK
ncbi:unnamed protein product [marine sediment metagenome]|uniref:Uncharacterized protein n=1 Tax=marine sediment metagenome TaxID=412755 RepID=X1GNU1_9ZZZZ